MPILLVCCLSDLIKGMNSYSAYIHPHPHFSSPIMSLTKQPIYVKSWALLASISTLFFSAQSLILHIWKIADHVSSNLLHCIQVYFGPRFFFSCLALEVYVEIDSNRLIVPPILLSGRKFSLRNLGCSLISTIFFN